MLLFLPISGTFKTGQGLLQADGVEGLQPCHLQGGGGGGGQEEEGQRGLGEQVSHVRSQFTQAPETAAAPAPAH